MRGSILFIAVMLMLMSCGGKKTQAESAEQVTKGSIAVSDSLNNVTEDSAQDAQEQDMEAAKAFVEKFYNEWGVDNLLDYEYPKQHITPKLLKYLADSYDYECEGECLATWKFFYEGGGDVGSMKSRQITARDGSHVLVENKYVNYEYDVLLTLVRDGDTFKIDSLQHERSEYIHMD